MYCTRCATPHHEDCWEFTGHCALYACGNLRYSWQPDLKGDVRTLRVPASRPSHALIERQPAPLAKPREEIAKKDLYLIDLEFPEEQTANGVRVLAWMMFVVVAFIQLAEGLTAGGLLVALASGALVALAHRWRRKVDAYYVVDRAERKLLIHRWTGSGSDQIRPVRSLDDIASVRLFAYHRMMHGGKGGPVPIGTYWLALTPERGTSVRVSDFRDVRLCDLETPDYPMELDVLGNEIAHALGVPFTGLKRVDEGTGRLALSAPLPGAAR